MIDFGIAKATRLYDKEELHAEAEHVSREILDMRLWGDRLRGWQELNVRSRL